MGGGFLLKQWEFNDRLIPMPELRKRFLIELNEGRITQSELRHWVYFRGYEEFVRVLYGGMYRPSHHVRLSAAWNAYEAGRLFHKPIGAYAKPKPEPDPEAGKFPSKDLKKEVVRLMREGYMEPDAVWAPEWNDLTGMRTLAAKRIAIMTREETDEMGISQSIVMRCKRGEVPKMTYETLMKVLKKFPPRKIPDGSGAGPQNGS